MAHFPTRFEPAANHAESSSRTSHNVKSSRKRKNTKPPALLPSDSIQDDNAMMKTVALTQVLSRRTPSPPPRDYDQIDDFDALNAQMAHTNLYSSEHSDRSDHTISHRPNGVSSASSSPANPSYIESARRLSRGVAAFVSPTGSLRSRSSNQSLQSLSPSDSVSQVSSSSVSRTTNAIPLQYKLQRAFNEQVFSITSTPAMENIREGVSLGAEGVQKIANGSGQVAAGLLHGSAAIAKLVEDGASAGKTLSRSYADDNQFTLTGSAAHYFGEGFSKTASVLKYSGLGLNTVANSIHKMTRPKSPDFEAILEAEGSEPNERRQASHLGSGASRNASTNS